MSVSMGITGGLGRKLRAHFIAGIIVIVPIGAALLILYWFFNTVDSILQPIETAIWGRTFIGVGFGATILLIYFAGVLASNVVGKKLITQGETVLARVPVLWPLYTGIKQIVESFAATKNSGFMQVVLVEFPRKGMRSIGFVTSEVCDISGSKVLSVLIPTAPNPTTGFLQIVREEEVIRTRISVDDALKMVISAGRMMPRGITEKIPVRD